MKAKFIILAVILPLMLTSCFDEEINSDVISVPTTIVSKHYEEPKTRLKYQFVMGKWQWWPSTEPEHHYVNYEYVLGDFATVSYLDDKSIFDSVEVGDKVSASFYRVTMKANKTGELYNKYYFRGIELQ